MQLSTYLIFSNNAEEAFTFYAQCLRGRITRLAHFGDLPDTESMPEATRKLVMNVQLELGDHVLMGSDCHPDRPYDGIKGCFVSIRLDDVAEAQRIFDELADGGEVEMPFEATFWSERFGMLVDRFGVSWMVNGGKQS